MAARIGLIVPADFVLDRGCDVFLAGTNTPSIEILSSLAARAGRPVLSANQVTMWASLRAAGLPASDLTAVAAPRSRPA